MAIIYTNQSSGVARRNRKKMKSLSANQIAKFKEDLRIHNKYMRSRGLETMIMSLDNYIKYRFGALPKVKTGFVPLQSVPLEKHLNIQVYQIVKTWVTVVL
jgi:hypothetical protein